MSKKSGFTLIEVMIVIVIIAVMSAVVTMNVGSPSYGRFMTGVSKIANTFSALSDEAIYTSSVISCNLATKTISCSRYKDGEWSDLKLNQIVSWNWPKDFKILHVKVSGVDLKEGQMIKFLPSGDNQSLSIEVSNDEFSAWIDSDLAGHYNISS